MYIVLVNKYKSLKDTHFSIFANYLFQIFVYISFTKFY